MDHPVKMIKIQKKLSSFFVFPEDEVGGQPGVPPGGDDVQRPPAPPVPALHVGALLKELQSEQEKKIEIREMIQW